MIHSFLHWKYWYMIVLYWALFFSITIIENMVRDASMRDNDMSDHILIEKFVACVLWVWFYYLIS